MVEKKSFKTINAFQNRGRRPSNYRPSFFFAPQPIEAPPIHLNGAVKKTATAWNTSNALQQKNNNNNKKTQTPVRPEKKRTFKKKNALPHPLETKTHQEKSAGKKKRIANRKKKREKWIFQRKIHEIWCRGGVQSLIFPLTEIEHLHGRIFKGK